MGADTQVVGFDDRMYWSLSQLASAFGPARETISKRLKNANVISTRQRKGNPVFHIGAAARAILADEMPEFEEVADPDKLHPKDRMDWYRGSNEKNKFLVESGDLISRKDGTIEMASVVKILIRTLDIIPDLLEMKCGLSAAEIQIVENECDNARNDLAEKLEE